MKIFKNLFILIVLLSIIGCSNSQTSTRSQAEIVVAGQENFEDFGVIQNTTVMKKLTV